MHTSRSTPSAILVVAALATVFGGCAPGSDASPDDAVGSVTPAPTPVAIDLVPTTDFADPVMPSGRRLALEDYYRMRSVGGPDLSPDGEWVAFTVSTPVEATNDSHAEAWLVPYNGSSPARRVSAAGDDISGLRWGAGDALEWRAGDRRWSIAPGSVGPATALSDVPSGQDTEGTLSPDGAWRAVVRDQPPAPVAPASVSDFVQRHEERFEGAVWDWMNFQRDGRAMPIPDATDPHVNPPREIFLEPSGGGEGRQITELGLRPSAVRWAPDGSYFVFTADDDYRDELLYGRNDLWRADVDGTVTKWTPQDGLSNSNPVFSPDGRYIALTRTFGTDMVIRDRLPTRGPRDLWLLDTTSGDLTNLTADWDLQAGTPEWSPDSRSLYFTSGVGGATHLFRIDVEGGEITQVTEGQRRVQAIDHDESFERLVYRVATFGAPSELYAAAGDGSSERRLTDLHSDFTSEVGLSPAERLIFRSVDGTPIEGWLLYPHGYDPEGGPYPLIVHSHGGPHSASGYSLNFKHQLFAAHGYFVLQTNFRGSTGYGEAFTYATWGAWGDRDGEDVMAGVDFAIDHFPIDANRVATIGHSYGGFMSNWLIVRYPDRFAAAAVGAGISNWISDYGTADIAVTKETEFFGTPWMEEARNRMIRQSPLTYADRVQAATLFLHGEVDHRVPFPEAEQMFFAIKKQGIPAKMIVYEGQSHGGWGHWNNVHRMVHELGWFDRYLNDTSSMEDRTP